ncbi:hypothetical protein C8D78_0529 [Arthrobacter oryzae]|uniref:Secreted protein n=1 Tax=Arthrobacter oryzae TaxID=409290 RepID=A0A495FN90_9MICC|nr:hypothetical protein C8D78_0529 [Arthrobacter oryzae]
MNRLRTRAPMFFVALHTVACAVLGALVSVPAAEAAVRGLRSVHSGNTVVADLHLSARSCHIQTVNSRAGQYHT